MVPKAPDYVRTYVTVDPMILSRDFLNTSCVNHDGPVFDFSEVPKNG